MRPDSDLEYDVTSELSWRPDIDATDIAVKVKEGVVTLTGFAKNSLQKHEAENAAKRISGVTGVANELAVRPSVEQSRTDPEIAREIVRVIRAQLPTLAECVKVIVDRGHVTLEGSAPWHFLAERAETVARSQAGVLSIRNSIAVLPHVEPTNIKADIQSAFQRSADVDGKAVTVQATGSVVTLTGKVRSWYEREEAQRTAWAAPGVTEVKNQIVVTP